VLAVLLGGLALVGPGGEAGPARRLAADALLALGVLGPTAILPLRPVPSRRWGAAQAVCSGLLLPLGTLVLLRTAAPERAAPVWALVGASLTALAALRALAVPRLDAALAWIHLSLVGLIATALLLACPPTITLAVAVTAGAALAAVALAGERIRDLSGGAGLEQMGGLRRLQPALCVATVAAVAASIAVPPLPGFHALRGLVGCALAAGPLGLVTLVPVGATLALTTTTLVRWTALAFRGAPPAPTPTPARGAAAPALLLALAVAVAGPLLGAGITGPAPAWGLELSAATGLLPPRAGLAAGLLVGLAQVCGLSLAAWVLLGEHRRALLAPPETARGWILRIDTRLEDLTPQRRLVQPLLRLATRFAAFDRARLEEPGLRVAGRLSGALREAARPGHAPAPAPTPEAAPAPRARFDSAVRDALLVFALAAALILATRLLS